MTKTLSLVSLAFTFLSGAAAVADNRLHPLPPGGYPNLPPVHNGPNPGDDYRRSHDNGWRDDGYGRPGRGDRFRRPRHERFVRCQQAQANLQQAQQQLNAAIMQLNMAQNICGNNMMCIVTIQNGYNQAVTNLQHAHQEVDYFCRGLTPDDGRPRPGFGR